MDQDDSMLSTPSSHANDDTYDDEENLFPSETTSSHFVSAGTLINDHLNAAVPGELSPPRSTANAQQANGFSATADDTETVSEDDEAIDVRDGKDERKPGAGWKNKKVQDDMQRSWEYIVDKDFDVRQFGDVLDDGKGK